MSRGYIETVAKALDDMVGRQNHMSESGVKTVYRSTTGELTFGHPGEAEVVGIVGVKKRLKETEVKKTKQKAKILSDFEALLDSEIGTAKVQATPGSEKKNKKKRKGNLEDGDVQAQSGSEELVTGELISEVDVRGMEEKVSGVEDNIHKKKMKKRTSEESLEVSIHQPCKSRRLSVSN